MTLIAIAVPIITFLMMTAVGFDLTPGDFARVRSRIGLIAAGLIGPIVLLPPLALLLNDGWESSPATQFGLLLIVACPIGGISNVYSYFAKAATALSVTLTTFSCLAAFVTIPLVARIFEYALGRPLGFGIPLASLAGQVLLLLVLPVVLGMIWRWKAPDSARYAERRFRFAAFAAFVVLVGLIVAPEAGRFLVDFREIAPVAAALVAASFATGLVVGRLAGGSSAECFTIAVEFGTRNTAIATAIGVTMLGQIHVAVVATVCLLVEIPLMAVAVVAYRTMQARLGAALAEPSEGV